jgi:DNA helicase-2/ATP-dependent DNA helicase PcrA
LETLARNATGRKVPGFEAAALFISAVDALGNDLIPETALAGSPFAPAYRKYRELLDQHRFLTFGLIISEAVHWLENAPAFRASVRRDLSHLLVDEYQDVNPAQERLISTIGVAALESSQPPTHSPRPSRHGWKRR